MDPRAPIEWDHLEAVRAEPTLRDVFDEHRDDTTDTDTFQAAVNHLKEAVRADDDVSAPDQGAAFVFAYLLEKEEGWDLGDGTVADEAGIQSSLVDRRPDGDTLERLFWEEGQFPWWQAVALGVHYTLVVYWLWEDDVPLMRQNLPDEQFERLDLDE